MQKLLLALAFFLLPAGAYAAVPVFDTASTSATNSAPLSPLSFNITTTATDFIDASCWVNFSGTPVTDIQLDGVSMTKDAYVAAADGGVVWYAHSSAVASGSHTVTCTWTGHADIAVTGSAYKNVSAFTFSTVSALTSGWSVSFSGDMGVLLGGVNANETTVAATAPATLREDNAGGVFGARAIGFLADSATSPIVISSTGGASGSSWTGGLYTLTGTVAATAPILLILQRLAGWLY